MTQDAKERLHKILNALFYLVMAINIAVPLGLLILSTAALLGPPTGLAAIWTIRLTVALALVEVVSQLRRFIKKRLNN